MSCLSCLKPSAPLTCSSCQGELCKKCSQFRTLEDFPLMETVDEKILAGTFCPSCFEREVAPFCEHYEHLAQEAEELAYFSRAQSKETRLMDRSAPSISIKECRDRQEALLKLAFKTVQLGFNGMIDVDLTSQKKREGGRQYSLWSGSAVPTQLDLEALARRELRR